MYVNFRDITSLQIKQQPCTTYGQSFNVNSCGVSKTYTQIFDTLSFNVNSCGVSKTYTQIYDTLSFNVNSCGVSKTYTQIFDTLSFNVNSCGVFLDLHTNI